MCSDILISSGMMDFYFRKNEELEQINKTHSKELEQINKTHSSAVLQIQEEHSNMLCKLGQTVAEFERYLSFIKI